MVRRGRALVRSLGLRPVNAGIVVGVVTLTLVWAATLPFAVADVWWERRHGISRESYVQALTNAWLGLLGRTIVAVIALAIVLTLARRLGRSWWLAAAPAIAGILLVLQLLSPYLASLGTHPVRSSRLRADIRTLERREHAGRPPVRVDDVSGQTSVANAFSIGIGPTGRVILWNTLLDGRFSPREIEFVVGHELGHIARNHVLRGVGWFALLVLPVLLVTASAADVRRPEAVPLALLVIALAQLAILPLQNAIARRYEREADWIGLNGTRDPAAARGLFVGFVRTSLQDPSPPGWVHVLLDDHPTPLQRVEMAHAWPLRH
jgi:STE24 endopeptidase